MPQPTEDRLQIRELIERFHDAVNHGEPERLGLLFAPDAIWEVAPPFQHRFEGPENIVAGISETVGKLDFLFQTCSPIVIDLQGNVATARTSMQEFGRFKDGGAMRVAGTYFDAFQKKAGVWRFTRRTFRARYADDAPLPGTVVFASTASTVLV
ncbi:MAG: nuclear transport factor 2 family protein [Xenophilus sp.]